MKVQRIRFPEREHTTWLVLDDEYRPVQPILDYLKFLDDLGRSPNTIRAAALHLKTFWEFLGQERVDWTEVDVAHLATFIQWLRRPDSPAMSIEPRPPRRTNATIDLMLTSVHGLYEYHQRLHTIPDLPLYRFVMMPQRRYKPLLHGTAKTKPVQTRIVSVKREQRRPKTLTSKQVQHLLDACVHTRDRFLLALLFSTGIRIGQALGLRHEDVSVEDGTIRIVPREDNSNGARAKTRTPYTIPCEESLMKLYTDYLINELGALEAEALPDFVFVNLWEGSRGRPMTYDTVRSLVKRLSKQTSEPLKRELKYAIWHHYHSGAWKLGSDQRTLCCEFSHLTRWLNIVAPHAPSLMIHTLEYWEVSLRSYLTQLGRYKRRQETHLRANQQYRDYETEDRRICLFRRLYRTIADAYDDREETDKDIWDLRKLGVAVNLTGSNFHLNFSSILQPWLRTITKDFMKYNMAIHSAGDCFSKLAAIRAFSHTQVQSSVMPGYG